MLLAVDSLAFSADAALVVVASRKPLQGAQQRGARGEEEGVGVPEPHRQGSDRRASQREGEGGGLERHQGCRQAAAALPPGGRGCRGGRLQGCVCVCAYVNEISTIPIPEAVCCVLFLGFDASQACFVEYDYELYFVTEANSRVVGWPRHCFIHPVKSIS